MLKININGKDCIAEKGETILNVAKRNYIDIPTLCHNDSLKPYGVCRLCVVELEEDGKKRIVPSCVYKVSKEGLIVKTDTEDVKNTRREIIELFLAKAPVAEVLKVLAEEYSIDEIKVQIERTDCISCALCIRACSEIVGTNALGFSKGMPKKETRPYFERPDNCIGCGTCVQICPTKCIKMEDKDGKRILKLLNNELELELIRCKKCNDFFVTRTLLDLINKTTGSDLQFCLNCRE
jgi:NADH dehydrogenase/NADH:ubiquinone oxidoreductase subunit G